MAWAQGGPIYRLVSDTLDYNLSLYQYLMDLSSSQVKWSYVNTKIQRHVDKLVMIRSTANSRIRALILVYCYLRDAHVAGWQSSTLQAQRNIEMFALKVGDSNSNDNES
jgi:hypothetical protein